jgi:crotonobetainyl-CoA:carnitine CoA-transferase CaiB-like acyl-CoA transferase
LDDRKVFEGLLPEADVIVHGYRPGALEALGYGEDTLNRHAPAAIQVTLNAYGWTGPWSGRRGFDSLVQMSCGIAAQGQQEFERDCPVSLPVQALDHATGYLIAAAVLRALRLRQQTGQVMSARLSLARTAALLVSHPVGNAATVSARETDADYAPDIEMTGWGPARRIKFPVSLEGKDACWNYPAGHLRRYSAEWRSS